MKKYITVVFLFLSLSSFAQDHLIVKNRFNNTSFRFNTNYLVYLSSEEDTAMYSGWKIEHITDSSLILSSPRRYYEKDYFQETREVAYEDISFVRFEHVQTEETFYSTVGMVVGGFITLLAPAMACDEETGELNEASMYRTMIGGTVLLTTSYFIHKRFIKRRTTFDQDSWEFEPDRNSRKA